MANELPSEDANYELSQIELLEALLDPDDAPYPWNPAAPESEAYFAEREHDFVREGWLEEEIVAQTQTFFTKLEQLWSASTTSGSDLVPVPTANVIQAALQQQFADLVPQNWLHTIAQHAYLVFSTKSSTANQLAQCVNALLPNWAEEDLLVLARPFAYAMRGTETAAVEFVLNHVQHRDWIALSEIEQARVGIVLARYALDQLQRSQNP